MTDTADPEAGDAPKPGMSDDVEAEFSSSAFEALERDFQEVLSQLVGDQSLERFRLEYEKLHRALKRSHEHERKLIKKVRELNTEIVNNAAKVHTALKLSQEDQNTIATLRKEIEKAWKMVDVAREKEVRAKETINQLKDEIANLSKLVEKGAKLSGGQESMVKELLVTRDELQRQAEEQTQQTKVLQAQLTELNRQKDELEENHAAVKAKGAKSARARRRGERRRRAPRGGRSARQAASERERQRARALHRERARALPSLGLVSHARARVRSLLPPRVQASRSRRTSLRGRPRCCASSGGASGSTRSCATRAASSTSARWSRRRWAPRS